LIFGLLGCLEEFDPKIPDSKNGFLVIDGVITDQPGPYAITITKSSSLDEESEPVTGIADILIEAEDGVLENLTETDVGVYQTDILQGQVGNGYRLSFTYQNQRYQSSWETIRPSPIIDSVYFQEEIRGTTDLDINVRGLQFFIDNHIENGDKQYFRYEWEETWKFAAPAPILFDYFGNDSIRLTLEPPADICWKQINSIGINLATTENLTENVLSGHNLGFITGDDDRFTIRYSLLAKQFSIDQKEYIFWKNLEESNEELGNLFDRQPARVTGNVTNIDNTGELVLGYFSASGLREERIYIDNIEVSDALRAASFCKEVEILLKSELGQGYEQSLLGKIAGGAIFFDFLYQSESPSPIGALIVQPICADCTLNDGIVDEPDFWIE